MNRDVILREASASEIAGWDRIVERLGRYRVTHTAAWLRSLENSINGRSYYLVYERKGEIVACLPGMIVNVGFLKIFGSSLPGWQTASMGPVFDSEKITCAQIIEPLPDFLEKTYGVHHIEIVSKELCPEAMSKGGFRGTPEFTFETPLFPDSMKSALKLMKSSARRNITRAQQLGLKVRFREDEEFVDEVYDQISEVFVRGGNTVPFSKVRVEEFYRNMKQSGSLLSVAVSLPESDTCIATGLFTVKNRELLLWMWTHRTKYRWFRPTELMTWTVMQKAMELGCTKFDLMGRGDFKAKFGAILNGEKTRWVRSRYAWLTIARDQAERLYRIQQSLRGRFARWQNRTPSN